MKTLTPKHIAHENIYEHFAERQGNGHFDRYNADMQSFINRVWNKNLGVVAAMSHSGIGADLANGFVQFVANSPTMFLDLIEWLNEVKESLPRKDQPVIEIRGKSIPKAAEKGADESTHHLTVMFRTPRFFSKDQANGWWSNLVQSYN